MQTWSHLLSISLLEIFIFYAVTLVVNCKRELVHCCFQSCVAKNDITAVTLKQYRNSRAVLKSGMLLKSYSFIGKCPRWSQYSATRFQTIKCRTAKVIIKCFYHGT